MKKPVEVTKEFLHIWNSYQDLVEGLDGIISEQGELSDAYWKKNAMNDMDDISYEQPFKKDGKVFLNVDLAKLKTNLKDLLDGLDGWEINNKSSKYFKKSVITNAKLVLSKM